MTKQPLAVVTMAFNEAMLLPIWARHYSRQVGAEHCYVLDHGSTDGSTRDLPVNVLRLPRSPHDEHRRAVAAGDFCTSLLYFYDRVLFTDTDEMVVADPARDANLVEFVRRLPGAPSIVSAFGVDLLHDHTREGPLDWARPLTDQRSVIRPFNSLCKPTLIRERPDWAAGFHFSHRVPATTIAPFLYLFHIAFVDNDLLVQRQMQRNTIQKAQVDHHQIPPQPLLDHVKRDMETVRRVGTKLEAGDREFERVRARFTELLDRREFVQLDEFWELPRRFRGLI
ncbi:Glycosyl transferase family 2 [Methylobacterium sp. 190mf]|uniref:glycosyltransferase family 2 protein n=1 Tax=Methylobacterium sp. 190mf TaxID=1761798 RepID=UPI00089E9794|nr:glycosyltransferase family 2 protein [Methylobacterium sp. 190mf]SEF68705.1 Glycosyl transferase family 2 [Methylobacterium sp. 190mf]